MASGSYARKSASQQSADVVSRIPPRATRQLSSDDEAKATSGRLLRKGTDSKALVLRPETRPALTFKPPKIVEAFRSDLLNRQQPWLKLLIFCTVGAVIFSAIVLSAAIFQRPSTQLISYTGGQVYSVQVGGNTLANTWQSNSPMQPKVSIPSQQGPYSVLGKPSLNVDFINRVLDSYHSPAAGKGQALYDMGVQYGIDPAFALAFFLHESTMGTQGEARSSLSLGNLRCIPNARCQDHYAWFNSWEDGFSAWYQLIRNLYIAQWGLTTVDQIIPRYAPNSDNNNEAVYIQSLKHYLDTWHAGLLRP